jgi:hypothetical protein
MKVIMSAAALAVIGSPALAQEAMYTEAATMPSPGTFVLREQFHFSEHGRNPDTGSESTRRHEWSHSLQIGFARDVSLRVDVPMEWRVEKGPAGGSRDDSSFGIGEIDMLLKWRFFRHDSGGIDTLRAALLAGVAVPSGDGRDFSPSAVSPSIGAVVTIVQGRHGFNQDLILRWNTNGSERFNFGGEGPAEAVSHGSAYLYRIVPGEYTAESTGAWYLTAEVNGLYETNGDYELLWAPGLMYEGRFFALELMAQFPLSQAVSQRPELDLRLGLGVRFTF